MNKIFPVCLFLFFVVSANKTSGEVEMNNNEFPKCPAQNTEKAVIKAEHNIHQPSTVFKRHAYPSEALYRIQNMCLNNFVNRLQSFVHPCFDHTVFYPQIKHLEITLAAIEVSVLKWKPCPETILKQVAFAKLFFSKLIETTSLLKKFPLSHDMAESLVHKVIQLNVRTFQFYNTHGEPNPEKRHYTHILFNFMYLLRSCRVKFNGLSNVPLATRRVFEDQISQLEKTLQDLETYLPQSQGSRS